MDYQIDINKNMKNKTIPLLYTLSLISMIIIGVLFNNLIHYRNSTQLLVSSVDKYKKTEKLTNAKISVLETHYFNKVENYSDYEYSIADLYNTKLNVVKRDNAIIKNVKFIDYLASHEIDVDYIQVLAGAFYDAANVYNIDQKELIATAWHESRFQRLSRSSAGAIGIMQIMPLWLSNNNFSKDLRISTIDDLYDPVRNIHAGAFIYNHYKEYWTKRGYKNPKNIKRLALLSYNRGHNRVSKLLKKGINPANGYYKVISKKYRTLVKLEKRL